MVVETRFREQQHMAIVGIKGSIESAERARQLGGTIAECIVRRMPNVVLDLTDAQGLGAAALAVLLTMGPVARSCKGGIRLMHPENATEDLAILAKLVTIFETVDDEDEGDGKADGPLSGGPSPLSAC